jgi:arginase family enzyme
MDCDEKHDSILDKLHVMATAEDFDDPLNGVLAPLRSDTPSDLWDNIGTLSVPTWLGPKPCPEDRSKITAENFISFIDSNGCKTFADAAGQLVTDKILPQIPCMIGIDHCLTGGIYAALAKHYGPGNLSLIILDSHTDAIPMSALSGAIQYDAETNPDSVHDSRDPFLYNRPDSYNASSFVHTLVSEKLVAPKNLYLLGISDYPEKKSLRIKDPRIKAYTNAFVRLKGKGVNMVTKKECKLNPGRVKGILKKISTPYVYVSIDMDIGANNAVEAVRFRNWTGLSKARIMTIAKDVADIFTDSIHLAGMDVCEMDPRRAGLTYDSGKDQTYRIAADLIKTIAFRQ